MAVNVVTIEGLATGVAHTLKDLAGEVRVWNVSIACAASNKWTGCDSDRSLQPSSWR